MTTRFIGLLSGLGLNVTLASTTPVGIIVTAGLIGLASSEW